MRVSHQDRASRAGWTRIRVAAKGSGGREPWSPWWKLLSIEDVAEFLGVPVNTLYTWRKTGKGPAGFRVGKYVRYRPDDVDAWITEQAGA